MSQIYASSNQYQVVIELLPQYQRDQSALERLYLHRDQRDMVPLSAVVPNGVPPCPCRSTMPAKFRR